MVKWLPRGVISGALVVCGSAGRASRGWSIAEEVVRLEGVGRPDIREMGAGVGVSG